jgi:hypothetical protein
MVVEMVCTSLKNPPAWLAHGGHRGKRGSDGHRR